MQDAMDLAAEAATEADIKTNSPVGREMKAPHSRGHKGAKQRQSPENSEAEASGEDSEEQPQHDAEEEDSQEENENEGNDHERGDDPERIAPSRRGQEPASTPRASAYAPASAAGRRTVQVWSEDLEKNEPPELKSCLTDARRRFCNAYKKYVFTNK